MKELSANSVAFISCRGVYFYSWWKSLLAESSFVFSPGSLHYTDVYRHESGRCRTLPFLLSNLFYHFTFPDFSFILMYKKEWSFINFALVFVSSLCHHLTYIHFGHWKDTKINNASTLVTKKSLVFMQKIVKHVLTYCKASN